MGLGRRVCARRGRVVALRAVVLRLVMILVAGAAVHVDRDQPRASCVTGRACQVGVPGMGERHGSRPVGLPHGETHGHRLLERLSRRVGGIVAAVA
jgi:hypothetical protein